MLKEKEVIDLINDRWKEVFDLNPETQQTAFIAKVAQIDMCKVILGRENIIESPNTS